MIRMRLASLLLASGLMLVCGCNCTGFCLSWHPQCCGNHHCGHDCCGHNHCGTGCGLCCEPRTCCDIGIARPCCMPQGGIGAVPVADIGVQAGGAGPQLPRVHPVPQANPLPYTP